MADNWVFLALNSSNAVTTITMPDSQTVSTTGTWPVGKTAGGEWAPKVLTLGPTGTSSNTVQGTTAAGTTATGNPVYVAGVYFNSPYAPAGTQGTIAPLAFNPVTGRLYVESESSQKSTVSTATPVTTDSTVFTLAGGEKGYIQNLAAVAVYVKLGASASSSSFNWVLKAGTAANDGLGGVLVIDDYIGAVSIAAASSTPRVSAFKLS